MTQTRGIGSGYQAYDSKMILAAGKEVDINAFKTYFDLQKAVLEKEINGLDNQIKTVTGGDISQRTTLSDDLDKLKTLQYINNHAAALINSTNLSGNPTKDAKEIESYKKRIESYDNEARGIILELSEKERQYNHQVMPVPNADRKSYSSYPHHFEPYYVDLDISNNPEKLAEIGKRVIELKKQKIALLKKYNLTEPLLDDIKFVSDRLSAKNEPRLKDKKLMYSKFDRFFNYIQKLWNKNVADRNIDIS